jgi:hypothetical protein
MRGLGLIVSLLVAAAIGAAAGYFLKPVTGGTPPRPLVDRGPGNGVVTCPGNASCPRGDIQFIPQTTVTDPRQITGIAAKGADITSGRVELCNGSAAGHCPAGYVGYLVKHTQPINQKNPAYVFSCAPTDPGYCGKNNIGAVYCRNPEAPQAPNLPCDVLLGVSDPDYQPHS